MRNTFIDELTRIAATDDRIWLLCGDLGYSVLEKFANAYPDRYVNCGVAEQNMTGVAAGLAAAGKIVFTYSIANFPILRCLEQIRDDVCYHNLNVKIVAVGGGLAYGSAGYTHHAVEDLGILRTLPNMTVVAPGDPTEARLLCQQVIDTPGPCYIRLGKAGEPQVHQAEPPLHLGRALTLRSGRAVCLISTGGMLQTTMQAADDLADQGIEATVLSMHTLQPLDVDAMSSLESYDRVVTVEEHVHGGLGSAVAEYVAERSTRPVLRRVCLRPEPIHHAGSQMEMAARLGVSRESIVAAAVSQ